MFSVNEHLNFYKLTKDGSFCEISFAFDYSIHIQSLQTCECTNNWLRLFPNFARGTILHHSSIKMIMDVPFLPTCRINIFFFFEFHWCKIKTFVLVKWRYYIEDKCRNMVSCSMLYNCIVLIKHWTTRIPNKTVIFNYQTITLLRVVNVTKIWSITCIVKYEGHLESNAHSSI